MGNYYFIVPKITLRGTLIVMRKIYVLFVIILFILLNGCGDDTEKVYNDEVKYTDAAAVHNEVYEAQQDTISTAAIDNKSLSPTVAPKPIEVTPLPTVTPMSAPVPIKSESKISENTSPKIEKFGWSFKLVGEEKSPQIPSKAKELLSEYGGIYVGDTTKKVIYLTFDEGYENGYTPKILDVLKENNIKSIFFITGSYLNKNPKLVKRMIDEGHKIGNHSVSHPSFPEIDDDKMLKEVKNVHDKIKSDYGADIEYFRFPKGEYNERTLKFIKNFGYKPVFWSYTYLDYNVNNQKGADYAYSKVMDNLHNGEVLLLHAVSKDNTEALDRIIKDIIAKGYGILQLDL